MSEVRTHVKATTRAQREAIWKLFKRSYPATVDQCGLHHRLGRTRYRAFRKGFCWCIGDYIGGQWKGMFVGIERDGYTHT